MKGKDKKIPKGKPSTMQKTDAAIQRVTRMKMREAIGKDYLRYDVFCEGGKQYYTESDKRIEDGIERLAIPLKDYVLSIGAKAKNKIPLKYMNVKTDDSPFRLPCIKLRINATNI